MRYKKIKLLIVVLIPALIWVLIGYWHYLSMKIEIQNLHLQRLPVGDIPYWLILILFLLGYYASVAIGYSIFFEKKYWGSSY